MTSEVVPFQPPNAKGSTLDVSREAYAYAKAIADTDFVPKAMRGKSAAVLACMMTGHEAGLPLMQSLRSIHIVDGRPAMSAELMRALVLRAGHEIWTSESSSQRVTVNACRAGSSRESSVTWTMDDARRANLAGKNNWKSYPMAMLEARATTAICRRMFPDVLAGISHSIEELTDGDMIDPGTVSDTSGAPAGPPEHTPENAPKTVKAQATAAAPSKPDAPDVVAAPPDYDPGLPGEEYDDDIVDAEIVEPEAGEVPVSEPAETVEEAEVVDEVPLPDDPYPPDDEPAATHDEGPRMSGPQLIAMRFADIGLKDREDKLAAVAAIVDHDVNSAKDLTPDEITTVLEWIAAQPAGEPLTLDIVIERVMAADTPEIVAESEPERRTAVSDVDTWDEARWRQFVKTQKLTIPKAIKIAQAIGAEQNPVVKIVALADLVGSPIGDEVAAQISEGKK